MVSHGGAPYKQKGTVRPRPVGWVGGGGNSSRWGGSEKHLKSHRKKTKYHNRLFAQRPLPKTFKKKTTRNQVTASGRNRQTIQKQLRHKGTCVQPGGSCHTQTNGQDFSDRNNSTTEKPRVLGDSISKFLIEPQISTLPALAHQVNKSPTARG